MEGVRFFRAHGQGKCFLMSRLAAAAAAATAAAALAHEKEIGSLETK